MDKALSSSSANANSRCRTLYHAGLKRYEDKVLTADERAKAQEYELFLDLRCWCRASRRLRGTAEVLGQLDVSARLRNWRENEDIAAPCSSRNLTCGSSTAASGVGHHCVGGTFVNDAVASPDGMCLLITGPICRARAPFVRSRDNVDGSSGRFVPAREATIGVADRIFARWDR
jgi:DNA mismatch repair protein MutS